MFTDLLVTAARFAEDLLLQAHQKASRNRATGYWSEEWKVFLTPKVQNVVLSWDKNLIKLVSSRCQVGLHNMLTHSSNN